METNYYLSLEEMIMSLVICGETEMAKGLFLFHIGDVNEEDRQHRLLPATHGLLARHLARLGDNNQLILNEPFARIMDTVTHPEYSIRLIRVDSLNETHFVCHFKGERAVAQVIQDGVGYSLEDLDKPLQRLVLESAQLFEISQSSDPNAEYQLPLDQFNQISARAATEESNEHTVISPIAELLQKDLLQEKFRGSLTRIEYREKQPVSDYGCLILSGVEHTWIVRIIPDQQVVVIHRGSRQGLQMEINLLAAGKYMS